MFRDGDGILDFLDNCPDSANPSQSDRDSDGSGDICDDDTDNDGKLDSADHCTFVPDPNVFNGEYNFTVYRIIYYTNGLCPGYPLN